MSSQDEKDGLLGSETQVSSVSSPVDDHSRQRSLRARICSLMVAALLTIVTFASWRILSNNDCHKVIPFKSVEERVRKILSETPLIGTFFSSHVT